MPEIFSSTGGMSLELVVWSLFVGIVLGSFGVWYSKRVLGSLVKALLEAKADSESNAKSMADLGLKNSVFYNFSLRKNGTYRKIVHIAGDGSARKYYIPENMTFRADAVYNKRGTTIIGALVTILAFFVMALIVFTIVPDLIQMLENVYNQITGSGT
jgi:hypothetical protein